MKKALLGFALLFGAALLGAATLCHSEEYRLAKAKLDKIVLTPAQKQEIAKHEDVFNKAWRRTHSEKGCSHHEDHVEEFVAAASGVLTDDQFKKFRGRTRNDVESLGWRIRGTRIYCDNLLKIAKSL